MLASDAASSMLLLASGFSTISREDVSEEAADVQLERRHLLVSLILASLMVVSLIGHWPKVQAARRGLPQPTGIAAGLSTLTVEELGAAGEDNDTSSSFWQTSASAFWPPHAESRDLRRATAL